MGVATFPLEWRGLHNGELLDLVEKAGFEVLITVDGSMRFQQSFRARQIGVVVLPFQRLDQLLPIMTRVVDAIGLAKSRTAVLIGRDGTVRVEPLI